MLHKPTNCNLEYRIWLPDDFEIEATYLRKGLELKRERLMATIAKMPWHWRHQRRASTSAEPQFMALSGIM